MRMSLLHRNGLMVKLHCSTRCWPPGVERFSEHPASGQPSTRDKLSSFSWRKQVWTVQGGEGVYHLHPPRRHPVWPPQTFSLKPAWRPGGCKRRIKPNDYVERVEEMLNANFVDENGEEKQNEGPIARRDVCRSTLQPYPELPEASWTATGKTPPAPSETLRMRTRRGHSPVFRDALNSSRFRPEQKLPTDFLMNLLMFVLTCNLALHLWIIFLAADIGHCHRDGGVRYAKSLAIQYFIAINILQNSFI